MKHRILPAYYFTLECLFLYFLLFLFYIESGEVPSIFSFFIVSSLSVIVLLYGLKKQTITGTFPFIGAILSGGMAYLLDFNIMSVILSSVFLFFRLTSFFKDDALWIEERSKLAILFYCSGFIIFLAGWIFKYPHMNWLFGIVIAFTILLSVGSYLQHLKETGGTRNISGITSTIGIAVLLTGGVTLLLPLVKWLFKNIFEGLILFIGIILTPIFKLIESFEFQSKLKAPSVSEFKLPENSKERSYLFEEVISNTPILIWFVLFIVILLVVWYFVRKMRMANVKLDKVLSLEMEHSPTLLKMEKKRRFFREPPPQEYIRKLFFQLQIYAEKHGMGRYDHETIREWFNRVGFQTNEELILAYESVRYGGGVIPKRDAKHYEEMIQKIKNDIKERTIKKKGREA